MKNKLFVLIILFCFAFADSPVKKQEQDIMANEANYPISPIKEMGYARTDSRNTEFIYWKVDSSKNGYGAFLENNNPLAYSYDAIGGGSNAGWVAVYRQFGTLNETAGFLGVAQSDPYGEQWFVESRINTTYPPPGSETYNGIGDANLPTADGAPGARYPNGLVSSYQNRATAVYNEYTTAAYGGGDYGGVPMLSYDFFGVGENSNFSTIAHLNEGCFTFPCDPPDLWNANAQMIDANDGTVRLVAGYRSWATSENNANYLIRSLNVTNGYVSVDAPQFWRSDTMDMDPIDGDCLWYLCSGYTGRPDFHINNSGVGYTAFTAFTYESDETAPYLRSLYFKKTTDFGVTWTETGGYKNTGYHYISDDELVELSDSLYTLWTLNADDYPEKPWYPWAECTDSTGATYACGDTINFSDDTSDFFYTPGFGLFYQYDVMTDQDGGIHFAANAFTYLCKDLDNGCEDNDGDNLADSIYSDFRFPGGGMYHFYNADPIGSPDNWSVSFLQDFSDAYSADWLGTFTTTYDVTQYFYPNISPSYEGGQVIWYGASNMSIGSYNADTTLFEPRDIDMYMSKSIDNGRTWTEIENITNTVGSASNPQLEVGMHLANIGSNYDIGVFCQVPNFNVVTIDPPAGFEDYMNYVYIGKYENSLAPLSTDDNNDKDIIPAQFVLKQNYPNPFNPLTKISYDLDRKSNVTLNLFDVRGGFVETLISKYVDAGSHDYLLDASHLPSGVYFYAMTVNDVSQTKKLILMK